MATKKSNRPEAVGHLYKTHFENRSLPLPIFNDTAKKKACDIFFVTGFWWELVDSNHRSIKQQIYSLSPLATREHAHILFAVIADCLYILSSEVAFVNYFFHGFSLFLSFSIFLRFTAIKSLSITAKDPKTFSVLRSFWS